MKEYSRPLLPASHFHDKREENASTGVDLGGMDSKTRVTKAEVISPTNVDVHSSL